MSKIIPFVLAGVGASATSVGSVYLIKGTAHKKSELTFENLDKFKEGNGGKCVKDLFGSGIDFKSGSIADLSNLDTIDTFLGTPSTVDAENRGCLIVNHRKFTTSDNWSGTFTWTWSFASGNKGFVAFTVATSPTTGTAKEMSFGGGFYMLEKEGSDPNKVWKVKHKKEVAEGSKKISDKNQLDNYFPKVGTLEGTDASNGPYWDFMPKENAWDKMCSTGSCSSGTPKVYDEEWSWQKKSGDTKKPHEWSAGAEWFKNIYGDSGEKLKNKFNSVAGCWNKGAKS